MKREEDELYTALLKCIDRLPRRTRLKVDAWWIAVLNKRVREMP